MSSLVPLGQNIDISTGRRVAIFGSTGSVGVTSLRVLEKMPSLEIVALFAHSSVEKFVEQVLKYRPRFAGLVDPVANQKAKEALERSFDGEWFSNEAEIVEFASSAEYDIQLASVVGVEGFLTSFPAFQSGKRVALANKESLVVGGEFFQREAANSAHSGYLLPVDSEHSSLFRLLRKLEKEEVATIGLTASGGPFFRLSESELGAVTVDDALNHPTWDMGPRITIDSATLMNKGFELVEAVTLFDFSPSQVEVKIHPQSIVHGFVKCSDGSHFFHASPPDMAFPVAYALSYPEVLSSVSGAFQNGNLELLECDEQRFRAIALARQVSGAGTGERIRFYTSNELAVDSFLKGQLPFNKIVDFVDYALETGGETSPASASELLDCVQHEREVLTSHLSNFR